MPNSARFRCKTCSGYYPISEQYQNSNPKTCKHCVRNALLGLPMPLTPQQNQRYGRVKSGATSRKLTWLLTKVQFISIGSQPCSYCGTPNDNYGIDRIDSTLGYTPENCRSCCRTCNIAKASLTTEQFLQHCKRVVSYRKDKLF